MHKSQAYYFNGIICIYSLVLYCFYSSEEVFDFSSGQMTQTKTLVMKDTMCHEFSKVFQLCIFVLVRDVKEHMQ